MDLLSLLQRASVAVGAMGQSRPEMPRRIWDELSPWLARFAGSTAEKWLPMLLQAQACRVPRMHDGVAFPCENHAVTKCDCCQEPVCVHHARVDQYGDGICYLCVAGAIRAKRGAAGAGAYAGPREAPPVPGDVVRTLVSKSLRVLKVKRGATWEEVKKAHRTLSGEHHPDRVQDEKAKKKAEERFKEVQIAFQALEKHYKPEVEKAA